MWLKMKKKVEILGGDIITSYFNDEDVEGSEYQTCGDERRPYDEGFINEECKSYPEEDLEMYGKVFLEMQKMMKKKPAVAYVEWLKELEIKQREFLSTAHGICENYRSDLEEDAKWVRQGATPNHFLKRERMNDYKRLKKNKERHKRSLLLILKLRADIEEALEDEKQKTQNKETETNS